MAAVFAFPPMLAVAAVLSNTIDSQADVELRLMSKSGFWRFCPKDELSLRP